jgi:hypothetical protein
MISVTILVSVVTVATAVNSATAAPGTGAAASFGITVLTTPEPGPAGQLTGPQGDSLEAARRTADADPDNLSWPYIDRATGTLVVTATTQSGRATATALAAGHVSARALAVRAALAARKPGAPVLPALAVRVPARTVTVKHSERSLQAILDQVIGPDVVTPGIIVLDDYPDPEHNRVVLETNASPNTFLKTLATRYDPSAIAVRVVHRGSGSQTTSRAVDNSPFWAGAEFDNTFADCTSGFEWTDSSTRYMISAGHCAVANGGNGGGVENGSFQAMGTYGGWTWQLGNGTVSYNGYCCYGDISYVIINSALSNQPDIYVGGANSNSGARVTAMWNRSPANGDQYCTGGIMTGQECGWVTDQVGGNIWYSRDNATCRHCTWSYPSGNTTINGDSGGPVYTIDGLGYISAKGMISGRIDSLGNVNVYSDIWDAYWAFPGWLLTGPTG